MQNVCRKDWVAGYVQAAKGKDGFLRKGRMEHQRNKTKDIEGEVGGRRVEKVTC